MRGVYFVYKFRVKKCGHFYVGVTNNLDKRKVEHCSGINTEICRILFNRGIGNRKGKSSMYRAIAEEILKVHSFADPSEVNAKNILTFSIIDIMDTPKDACELEDRLIKMYLSNLKFINKQEASFYRHPVRKPRRIGRRLKHLKVYRPKS
jgi:predicted GIY-YIG superfamily endonuclease